jgi:hypothetical protein
MADRELLQILLRGFESKDLDYKGPLEWNEDTKKACCELVKDILGMANTLGGFIVIGVSEAPGGFLWEGLTAEQAATFDTTRLNRFLQNYCDPPINALLRKVTHDGKAFVIIEVPRFPDTPHICQKEFPGVLTSPTLYVRTDNNETAPIRSSADFRGLLEQATRNRGDALLTAFRSILVGGSQVGEAIRVPAFDEFLNQRSDAIAQFDARNLLKNMGYTGYREASFFPERFEDGRFTLDELRAAAERGHATFTGWPFLFISPRRPEVTYVIENGIETLIQTKDFAGNDRLDFWRFQQSGFFYHTTLMWEESRDKREGSTRSTADFGAVAIYSAEAIHCLTRLYDGLLDDGDQLSLLLRILGTQDRELTSPVGHDPLFGGYVCRIPQVEIQRKHPLAEWRAGVVDHAVEVSKEVFLRFNWEHPNLQAVRQIIERMFAKSW